ncbi:hypothetical protein SAMN05444156_1325 [Verrucomicrobium sp. GAS474]|uniref:hypothetical protein n=1 Tax=Verrucomicrobium sp. GAS474 TaxID=1882831 RepID=UPI000879E8F1|nr:hypothetical protein [Verrucomicrobium sp. GAS474]SDT99518.1 hypothetical protein SAMN05444156_1325 [Verrucomicrobium sp. GAS474]
MSLWRFDQVPNAATLTTRQVLEEKKPILVAVHYASDHSWAFLCGTTDDEKDARVIRLGEAHLLDPTIAGISTLPPGHRAYRSLVGGPWTKEKIED